MVLATAFGLWRQRRVFFGSFCNSGNDRTAKATQAMITVGCLLRACWHATAKTRKSCAVLFSNLSLRLSFYTYFSLSFNLSLTPTPLKANLIADEDSWGGTFCRVSLLFAVSMRIFSIFTWMFSNCCQFGAFIILDSLYHVIYFLKAAAKPWKIYVDLDLQYLIPFLLLHVCVCLAFMEINH